MMDHGQERHSESNNDGHSESYLAKLETKLPVLSILTVMLNPTHYDRLGPLKTVNKAHSNAVNALLKMRVK